MNLALLCLIVTIALYFGNKKLYFRYKKNWLSPLVVTPILLVAWVVMSGIAYPIYARDTGWLTWLLGPATVAFAVPVYEYRKLVREHWIALSVGTVAGVIASLASALGLARVMRLPPEMSHSLLLRSISTPFAIALSPEIGASTEIAALLIVLTGMFGMLIGEGLLALLHMRSFVAIGMPMGAAAHAAGTAKARQIGEQEGVMASLTMVFSGLVMIVVTPWLVRVVR